jgi:hypothetical protein
MLHNCENIKKQPMEKDQEKKPIYRVRIILKIYSEPIDNIYTDVNQAIEKFISSQKEFPNCFQLEITRF